jgi:hypothetical protein
VIEPSAHVPGPPIFVGVFVVDPRQRCRALTRSRRPPRTAWTCAVDRDRVERAGGAFVAALPLASYAIAPSPMDLTFSGGLVLTVMPSVLIVG